MWIIYIFFWGLGFEGLYGVLRVPLGVGVDFGETLVYGGKYLE